MGYSIWCTAYMVFGFKFSDILEEINKYNHLTICQLLDECSMSYAKRKMSDIIKEYYNNKEGDHNCSDLLKFITSQSKKKISAHVEAMIFTWTIKLAEINNYECKNTGSKYTPILCGGTKTPFSKDTVDMPKNKYGITNYTTNIKMVLCSD